MFLLGTLDLAVYEQVLLIKIQPFFTRPFVSLPFPYHQIYLRERELVPVWLQVRIAPWTALPRTFVLHFRRKCRRCLVTRSRVPNDWT